MGRWGRRRCCGQSRCCHHSNIQPPSLVFSRWWAAVSWSAAASPVDSAVGPARRWWCWRLHHVLHHHCQQHRQQLECAFGEPLAQCAGAANPSAHQELELLGGCSRCCCRRISFLQERGHDNYNGKPFRERLSQANRGECISLENSEPFILPTQAGC